MFEAFIGLLFGTIILYYTIKYAVSAAMEPHQARTYFFMNRIHDKIENNERKKSIKEKAIEDIEYQKQIALFQYLAGDISKRRMKSMIQKYEEQGHKAMALKTEDWELLEPRK